MIIRSLNTISNKMLELNSPFPLYKTNGEYFSIKDYRYNEIEQNKVEELKELVHNMQSIDIK